MLLFKIPTGMAFEGSEVTKIRNFVCDPSMGKGLGLELVLRLRVRVRVEG